jgi:hypothetical protein
MSIVPDAKAWIMLGPDSKVVTRSSSPASRSQPSPLATNIGEAPMIGITPTRAVTGAAWAGTVATRADRAAAEAARRAARREIMGRVSGWGRGRP